MEAEVTGFEAGGPGDPDPAVGRDGLHCEVGNHCHVIRIVIVGNAVAIGIRTWRTAWALDIIGHAVCVTIAGTRPCIIGVEVIGNAIAISVIVGRVAVGIGVFAHGGRTIAIVVAVEVVGHAIAVRVERRTRGGIVIAIEVAVFHGVRNAIAIAVGIGQGGDIKGKFRGVIGGEVGCRGADQFSGHRGGGDHMGKRSFTGGHSGDRAGAEKALAFTMA